MRQVKPERSAIALRFSVHLNSRSVIGRSRVLEFVWRGSRERIPTVFAPRLSRRLSRKTYLSRRTSGPLCYSRRGCAASHRTIAGLPDGSIGYYWASSVFRRASV
jgi:hypothetical protein